MCLIYLYIYGDSLLAFLRISLTLLLTLLLSADSFIFTFSDATFPTFYWFPPLYSYGAFGKPLDGRCSTILEKPLAGGVL